MMMEISRMVGNVRNVRNFRNVRTDIKCYTFLEPQPRADLNDDGNVRNYRNVGNVRNVGNIRKAKISGMSGQTSSVIPFQNDNF